MEGDFFMAKLAKSTTFNRRKLIFNISTTAILSALGAVLMIIGHYLPYPIAPFLKLEPSDTVVIVAYAICGFPSAFCTAIIKTLLDFLINGPTGAYAIGQIIALTTSMCYVLGIYLCSSVFKFFKKGLPYRILSYVITIAIVNTVMTLLNYLIFTPIFLTGRFTTFLDPQFQGIFENGAIPFKGPFIVVIICLYLPFNLLKGLIVCAFYELVFNRLIFKYFKQSNFYERIQKPVVVNDDTQNDTDNQNNNTNLEN